MKTTQAADADAGVKDRVVSMGMIIAGALLMAIGLLVAGVQLVRHTHEALIVDRYQPGLAVIESVDVLHGRKGRRTLKLQYRYEWQGTAYQGSRHAPLAQVDNAEVEATAERLDQARQAGRSVPVWIDPQQPGRAMLDKTVQWGSTLWVLPFMIMFPAGGLALMWQGRQGLSRASSTQPADAAPDRQAAARTVVVWLGGFSLAWWSMALPISLSVLRDTDGRPDARWLVLIFPIAGVALLHRLWRTLRIARGDLQPVPPLPSQDTAPGAVPTGSTGRLKALSVLLAAACVLLWQRDAVQAWAAQQEWLHATGNTDTVGTAPTTAPLTPAPARSGADERLLSAARDGDADAAQQALDAGARIDAFDDSGESALMQAAAAGHTDVVRLLLDREADVHFTNTIHRHQRGDTALLRAAYRGHADIFLMLLDAGARIDVHNQWDWTPAHMAAAGDCVPCLEALHARAAPLDTPAPASRGETPFMMAAARGGPAALAWLKAHGVDVHRKDPHGHDALGWARFGRQTANEVWLRQHVPDLDVE